jgi:hypothetical protein
MRREPQWAEEFQDALLAHCYPLTHGRTLVVAIVALADGRSPQYLGHVRGVFQADIMEDRYYLGTRQDGQWMIEQCPAQLVKGRPPLLLDFSADLFGR